MNIASVNAYNILCIDDNDNNLFTLGALLKNIDNLYPIMVNNADKGLKILLKEKIDLILLDVQMPGMNGFEVAKLIKSNKLTRDIPIIFITAVFKSEEFIREGFDIGAIDYLTKPINDRQLINKISLYLKVFDKTKMLENSEKKFYGIAQSIGDGIYTLDLDLKVTFVNNAALSLLGFTKKELLGKDIHDFIHYKDTDNNPLSKELCKIHRVVLDGHHYHESGEHFIKRDGSFLSVSVMASPLFEDNNVVGVVVVFRDKTSQKIISKLEADRIKNQEQIIYSMVGMIESRDSYTAGHTKRVAEYSEIIATDMGYSIEMVELLKKAAWLHDIGKISTPDNILLKPTKLNQMEYELIKDHLIAGYNMLREIDDYKEIAEIMVQHHERYDGEGYPNGLKADEILPLSRIMIVADAFDAMTTNRVYKPKKSVEDALKELRELSGEQFHPEVVAVAIKSLTGIKIDENISQMPKSEIEEQRFSYFYRDQLTNLFVIEYLQLILRYSDFSHGLYFYNIKLHNFSNYNRKYGWKRGNIFLVEFAEYLEKIYQDNLIFRVEGDDFLVLSQCKIHDKDENFKSANILKDCDVQVSIDEIFSNDIKGIEEMIELYS